MKYTDHQNNEKSLRSLTGFSPEQFRELLPYFAEAHNEYFPEYDMNGNYRNSGRSFVIYKNSPLPAVKDRLFFILVYLKNHPLQEYHAGCFGMDRKQCNSFIHTLSHILTRCLDDADVMPTDSRKKFNVAPEKLVREEGRSPVLLHDGTEREIPRPVDEDEPKENYSGKKRDIPSRTQ
jgi:hypothetical protein